MRSTSWGDGIQEVGGLVLRADICDERLNPLPKNTFCWAGSKAIITQPGRANETSPAAVIL